MLVHGGPGLWRVACILKRRWRNNCRNYCITFCSATMTSKCTDGLLRVVGTKSALYDCVSLSLLLSCSPFLNASKRELLADCALPVAVLLMSFFGSYVFRDVKRA